MNTNPVLWLQAYTIGVLIFLISITAPGLNLRETQSDTELVRFRDAAHPDRMETEKGRGSLCSGHHTLFGELE